MKRQVALRLQSRFTGSPRSSLAHDEEAGRRLGEGSPTKPIDCDLAGREHWPFLSRSVATVGRDLAGLDAAELRAYWGLVPNTQLRTSATAKLAALRAREDEQILAALGM